MNISQDILEELRREGNSLLERFLHIITHIDYCIEAGVEVDYQRFGLLLRIIRPHIDEFFDDAQKTQSSVQHHSDGKSMSTKKSPLTSALHPAQFSANVVNSSLEEAERSGEELRIPESLLDLVAALEFDRNRFASIEQSICHRQSTAEISSEMIKALDLFARHVNEIQKVIMKARMVPISAVLLKLTPIIHDLSCRFRKQVELIIEGGETELDRVLLEELFQTLMDLVQHRFVNGIEAVEERRKSGKPDHGTIRLSTHQKGHMIVISIEDDGREVEMRTVRKAVQKLKGVIDFDCKPGEGNKITFKIPRALTFVPATIVEVMGEFFAIPSLNVIESMAITRDQIQKVGSSQLIRFRDDLVPLVSFAEVLGVDQVDSSFWYRAPQASLSTLGRRGDWLMFVALGVGSERFGFVVDRIVGQQDIVIKPLSKLLGRQHGFAGGCVLSDGRVALVVDAVDVLAKEANQRGAHARRASQTD